MLFKVFNKKTKKWCKSGKYLLSDDGFLMERSNNMIFTPNENRDNLIIYHLPQSELIVTRKIYISDDLIK